MTITNTDRVVTYIGNGSTTAFPFSFQIPDADSLSVELTYLVDGTITVVDAGDYTASGLGNPLGGTITYPKFGVPITSDYKLTIYRRVPRVQETVITNQTSYYADVVMEVWDRLVMMLQEVDNDLLRSFSVPLGEVAGPLPAAAARADKYLLFDGLGNPTAVDSQIDARYYGEAATDPTTRPDGTARQTGDLYFNTVLSTVKVYTGTAWQSALPSASLTLTNYREVSTTAKTTFTIPGGYQTSAVFIYLNGVLLDTAEYTASNGTTVVLSSTCAINDELRCVSYSNFSVADTVARSNNLADLPSPSTALTNLGVSTFVKTLLPLTTDALFRTAIGLAFGATAAKASTLQAQIGSDDVTLMTPSKTKDAIVAQAQKTSSYQEFTASGTWTKPTGYPDDTMVTVEAWGGGGGGGRDSIGGGGGGGGAYTMRRFRIVDLPSSVAVSIGAGGTGAVSGNTNGTAGGNTTFGTLLTAYGGGFGGGSSNAGGGGAGEFEAGGNGTSSSLGGTGGRAGGGTGGHGTPAPQISAEYAKTAWGGGGGGGGDSPSTATAAGGYAVLGGAGGGAGSTGTSVGGTSQYGGNGGNGGDGSPQPTAGSAKGGGGGGAHAGSGGIAGDGGRGHLQIWIG